MEAAREADRNGARVTLFENRREREPPWDSWVDLIRLPHRRRHVLTDHSPVPYTLDGREVRSVRNGVVRLIGGDTLAFDSIVVATGGRFEPTTLQGQRKQGVVILDGMTRYSELSERSPSIGRAIVHGEGEKSLQVAERLSKGGRLVTAIISGWRYGRPSSAIEAVIDRAANDAGVNMIEGRIERALGVGSLEAVSFDGQIIPCGTLVIVPRRVPLVPTVDASLGQTGGILVSAQLRSSTPSILAAGAPAELTTGLPPNSPLCEEALFSGRVAGANATGQWHQIQHARFSETIIFGLRWSRAGASTRLAGQATSGLEVRSLRRSSSACAIIYESRSQRIVGIETIASIDERSGDLRSAVSLGVTIPSLAYGSSIDITLISETARLGLPWSRS